MEDQDEHFQNDPSLHLHAMVSGQAERVPWLSQRPLEGPGSHGQTGVVGLKGETLWQTRAGSLERSVCVTEGGLCTDGYTGFE